MVINIRQPVSSRSWNAYNQRRQLV